MASETLLPLVSGFGLISGLTHIVKYISYTMLYWYINYSSTGTISTRLQDVESALTSRVKLDKHISQAQGIHCNTLICLYWTRFHHFSQEKMWAG